MRLLLDENLSYRAVVVLERAGFSWAEREERVVVTADADFSEMLALRGATGPSVIQLRSSDALTPDRLSSGFASPLFRSQHRRSPRIVSPHARRPPASEGQLSP